MLEVVCGHQRVDFVLKDVRNIVTVLDDEVPGDQEGSGFVVAIHLPKIASIGSLFHCVAATARTAPNVPNGYPSHEGPRSSPGRQAN